jgi:hypothetical protein
MPPDRVSGDGFYDEGALRHVAVNLFNGWGYNFYRLENQQRADDQLVRAKAGWLLGLAQRNVELAQGDFRRAALPAPTRANPYPDPAAVAQAQAFERLSHAIGALIGRIAAQPVPENDRMTQRYRNESATLAGLGQRDETLIGQCELLRGLVDPPDPAAVLARLDLLQAGLAAVYATLDARAALLQDRL